VTVINDETRAALARLAGAGFNERVIERWYRVPLWTDARYVPPPELGGRARRGVGGWIALFVAGETLDAAALEPLDGAALAALERAGLIERDRSAVRARVTLLPYDGLLVASDRADRGADAVGAPDLSALNTAASLPRVSAGAVLDVGCGAGLLSLLAARAGARVIGSDVDARALDFARTNAALNGLDVPFVEADLLAAAGGARYELVTFNAPLLRAPLATSDARAPARYVQSERGEALALEFLDGIEAVLAERGEALLHAQLTPAVDRALQGLASRAGVLSIVFAHSPDGTPHALTSVDRHDGRDHGRNDRRDGHRTLYTPLSPVCPHLRRELLEALRGPAELRADSTPLPAPWLELRVSKQLVPAGARGWHEATFGGRVVDEPTVALLERLRGAALADLALDADDRARLERLIAHGAVIVR
jgi:SAM-dependent methyltransferase